MAESAQYPLWFGKAIKLSYDLLRNRHLCPADEVKKFVERLVEALPPQGTLLPEVGGSRNLYCQWFFKGNKLSPRHYLPATSWFESDWGMLGASNHCNGLIVQ